MAIYTINQEHDGIEIKFDEKPTADTLTALKSAGFRWHKVKKIWYARQTADRLTLAKAITDGQTAPVIAPTVSAPIDPQKTLKAAYMEAIKRDVWAESPKMQEYAEKNAAYIVPLNNGDMYAISKPTIETRFCFGYGYCGISTFEQEKSASDMAQYARTNQNYFIEENLKDLNKWIEDLNDSRYTIYKFVAYCGCPADCKVKGIEFYKSWETPNESLQGLEKITDEERTALIEGYKTVKEAFVKRLNTYLKRYGLSKLHTWTYLSD